MTLSEFEQTNPKIPSIFRARKKCLYCSEMTRFKTLLTKSIHVKSGMSNETKSAIYFCVMKNKPILYKRSVLIWKRQKHMTKLNVSTCLQNIFGSIRSKWFRSKSRLSYFQTQKRWSSKKWRYITTLFPSQCFELLKPTFSFQKPIAKIGIYAPKWASDWVVQNLTPKPSKSKKRKSKEATYGCSNR